MTTVQVSKSTIGFSAAHFLTLKGHICERLHGHNYRLGAVVRGSVDPDTGFVVDFAELKRNLRGVAERLDHRVLVPGRNTALRIREESESVVIDYEWPGWLVVPRSHALILPVVHTTAEVLAEWIAREQWDLLSAHQRVQDLIIEVEESAGQSASYRMTRDAMSGAF